MTDLKQLTVHLLMKLNRDYGRYVQAISKEAVGQLKSYQWPGNVRELENVLARTMIYMEPSSQCVERHHLPLLHHVAPNTLVPSPESIEVEGDLQQVVNEYEKNVIVQTLKKFAGNRTKAAKALGISIRSLYYKMEKYNIA
jgi:transcriptional regulator with PAS, ATPase and Fis domain